jgi:hypothetical protein
VRFRGHLGILSYPQSLQSWGATPADSRSLGGNSGLQRDAIIATFVAVRDRRISRLWLARQRSECHLDRRPPGCLTKGAMSAVPLMLHSVVNR